MSGGPIDFRYALNQLYTASESLERAILKTPTGKVRNSMTEVNIKLNLLIEEAEHVLDVAKKADV